MGFEGGVERSGVGVGDGGGDGEECGVHPIFLIVLMRERGGRGVPGGGGGGGGQREGGVGEERERE